MIYNEFITSLSDISSYLVDDPGDGDLLFATIDRSDSLFNHLTCGIFRLKSGYSASGEVADGVFVISSASMPDWYWKRVCKGLPKVFSSGLISLAATETFTITHDADPDNKRYPDIVKYVVDSSSVVLSRSAISSTVKLGTIGKAIPFEVLQDYPAIALAKKYKIILDQDLSHAHGAEQPYGRLHKDGRFYQFIDASNTLVFTESGGVWSEDGIDTGKNPTSMTNCYGGIGTFSRYENELACKFVDVYERIGRAWTFKTTIGEGPYDESNPNSYSTGLRGNNILSDSGNIWTSKDWPPSRMWSYWKAAAEQYGYFKASAFTVYTNEYSGGHHAGTAYNWLFCPDSVLGISWFSQDSTDDDEVHIYNMSDGTTEDLWDEPGKASIRFGVSLFDKIIISGYQPKLCTVTKSGNEAQSVSITTATPVNYVADYGQAGSYNRFFSPQDPGVLDNGFYMNDYYVGRLIGTAYGDVCSGNDLEDLNGVFSGSDYYHKSGITHLPDNKLAVINGIDLDKVSICHLEVVDEFEDYAAIFENKLIAANEITSVTVSGTEPAGSELRFLIRSNSGDLYRWNGSNWVVTTDYYAGNTQAEWSSAPWSQVITDVGSLVGLDFIVCLISLTGAVSPVFTSLTVNYTKGTDYVLDNEFVHYTGGQLGVTIVSDTQTQIENTSGGTMLFEAKVFLME